MPRARNNGHRLIKRKGETYEQAKIRNEVKAEIRRIADGEDFKWY